MRHSFLKISLALVIVLAVGCGKSSQETTVPTPTDPNAPKTPNDPKAPAVTTKPGIPDLTGAAPVDLIDNTTFTQLEDFFGSLVYGPLVGNAKLKLTLAVTSGVAKGKMLFGFEDKKVWRDYTMHSFDNTGYIGTNVFDVIFQDDTVVARVQASRTSDALYNGKLMYRKRAATDAKVHFVYPGPWDAAWGARPAADANACAVFQWQGCATSATNTTGICPDQNDLVTPCRAYIDPASSSVKQMGTFTGTVSAWVP